MLLLHCPSPTPSYWSSGTGTSSSGPKSICPTSSLTPPFPSRYLLDSARTNSSKPLAYPPVKPL